MRNWKRKFLIGGFIVAIAVLAVALSQAVSFAQTTPGEVIDNIELPPTPVPTPIPWEDLTPEEQATAWGEALRDAIRHVLNQEVGIRAQDLDVLYGETASISRDIRLAASSVEVSSNYSQSASADLLDASITFRNTLDEFLRFADPPETGSELAWACDNVVDKLFEVPGMNFTGALNAWDHFNCSEVN